MGFGSGFGFGFGLGLGLGLRARARASVCGGEAAGEDGAVRKKLCVVSLSEY